ncbi:MAG: hypothetical protein A2017_05120 [Lentisphaerae bacterium GWF2_44_16]|nr:MAG: hypothetical protein A2017_05120 [Lentisphaerae bacterium GWF2_44_16]
MNKIKFIFFLILISFISGCGTTAKFVYPSNHKNIARFSLNPKYNSTIAVLPFEELRKDNNTSGTYYLYLIPLMPYGYMTYDRPDAARMFVSINQFDFDVSEDMAKAAATSIRRSGLFKDVFFTFGGEKDKADYILTGEIYSTYYKGRIFSYGLSIFGSLFWFLGFPSGTSSNELIFKLQLKSIAENKIIWEYTCSKDDYIVQGLYYGSGRDVKAYTTLMEDCMNNALSDLNKSLQKMNNK